MATTLTSVAAQITAAGISAPSYDAAYLWLVAQYQAIYGTDVILTADTQDGQWLAILAQAITDVNAAAIAVYNSFSPVTAQGTGLASVVKINGLQKKIASNSSCPVTITGTAGTTISDGLVKDDAGLTWSLPTTVVIPAESSIVVTATCQTAGAVAAAVGSITTIATPTRGWLSATNAAAASPGSDGESDAALRARQSRSTALPAVTPMESIAAAVEQLPGVTRVNYSHNDTGITNDDGVPAHSFCLVVEGGDASAIAQTIAANKLGAGTYGSISRTVIDSRGVPSIIKYDTPTGKRIVVDISIKPLPGYTVGIGNAIISAVAAYITGLNIGSEVDLNNVIAAAIDGAGARSTFRLPPGNLSMCIYGDSLAAADIPIAFNEDATCATSDVSLSLIS